MRLVLVQPALALAPDARNADTIAADVRAAGAALAADDLLLLPEHWSTATTAAAYEAEVRSLAAALGCRVVGGTHHRADAGAAVNAGVACAPDGAIIGRWEKLRPYADERARVRPGTRGELLVVDGRRFLVLVCADFWFADLIHAVAEPPDVVLVPALSVTRKPSPAYSRALWRHLAVARAYEYGVYVGISDWAADARTPVLRTSGVAGFADPTAVDPDALFRPLGDARVAVHPLDFAALDAFRGDRRARGFFWR